MLQVSCSKFSQLVTVKNEKLKIFQQLTKLPCNAMSSFLDHPVGCGIWTQVNYRMMELLRIRD